MKLHRRTIAIVALVSLTGLSALAAEKTKRPAENQQAVKQALSEFNSLIGGWKGVGQPKRGSTRGAWIEKAEWVWNFDKGTTSIHYNIPKGKLLTSAVLTFDPKQKLYKLQGNFADKTARSYQGKLAGNKLVLESQAAKGDDVYRITLTRLNPKRTLVLHERQRASRGFFIRIAEVGYTREGTSLAVAGAGEPECVVTGGKGTMQVSYKGQTYYVCCSGCRQAFEDDPEGIIAEYKQMLAERKKKKS